MGTAVENYMRLRELLNPYADVFGLHGIKTIEVGPGFVHVEVTPKALRRLYGVVGPGWTSEADPTFDADDEIRVAIGEDPTVEVFALFPGGLPAWFDATRDLAARERPTPKATNSPDDDIPF